MALVATVLIASVDAKEIGGALQRKRRSMKTRDTERTDREEGRVDGMGWDGMGEKTDVRGRRSEMGMAEASELLVLGIQGRA